MVSNIYDLNSPFVTPTAPQAPTPTAAPQATTATRRSSDRLMRAAAYLLTFAGLLFLAAFVVAVTPLGRIDADITVPFVAVFVSGLAAIAWAVLR